MAIDQTERAERFYNNEIYDDSYIRDYDLFDEISEQFNPIPKVISIMKDLSVQKEIGIEPADKKDNQDLDTDKVNSIGTKKELLESIWDDNKIQNMKFDIVKDMLLKKRAIIELVKKDEDIIFVDHEPSNVEIKGDMYCKIEGTKEEFDLDTKEFEEVKVIKEYYNVDGYKVLKETVGNKETTERPWAFDFLPVAEITTDYNIEPLLNKTDRINEIKAFLHNLFFIHGDPIAFQHGQSNKTMSDETKQKTATSRGKSLKLLNLGENELKYLEMNGNIAKLMMEEMEHIKQEIRNEYPEYELSSTLNSGNPSGETLKIIAIEIISRVNSFRSDVNEGLVELNNKALKMLGSSELEHNISFGGILPDNIKYKVEIIKELRAMGLITKETALTILQEFYPTRTEDELAGLLEEDKQLQDNINFSINGGE